MRETLISDKIRHKLELSVAGDSSDFGDFGCVPIDSLQETLVPVGQKEFCQSPRLQITEILAPYTQAII